MEQVPSFDQSTLEAWTANMKAMYDAWQSDSQQQAKQRQALQDKLNDQYLRFVEDQHTLTMRTADFGASSLQKHSDVIGTLQALIISGEIDTTAQGAMGNKLAEEFRSVAKQAVEAAVAAVPGTSAASQGTTGVAQGALQTQTPIELAQVLVNNNTIQTAILKALADVNTALGVILVKITATETKG